MSIKYCLLPLIFVSVSYASDIENIEELLNTIQKKTDLSSKTKMENGGISFIYTRDDLERMQANYLKDILKSVYPFGYSENKFGLSDPMYLDSLHPFVSSAMRIFIDNQEITTSLYGSGLIVLGDIDIGFIDHIEIYSQNPSYEFSTEPTFVLIKLFSKSYKKDAGGKVTVQKSNHDSSFQSIYHSMDLGDWNYFTYVSNRVDDEKNYGGYSKDKNVQHIFSTVQKENHNFLIQVIKQTRDAFLNYSLDSIQDQSTLDMDFVHVGYDTSFDHFSFNFTYDYMQTDSDFINYTDQAFPLYPWSIDSLTSSEVFTTEIKHQVKTEKNKLITGIKYRYKTFDYEDLYINQVNITRSGHTYQTVGSLFLENQYSIKENSIVTTGIQYADIYNNNSIQQDELLMYRLGLTHTTEDFVFKTVVSKTETSLDPYLVNSEQTLSNPFGYVAPGYQKPQELHSISQNIIYEKNENKFEAVFSRFEVSNYLLPNDSGVLENFDRDVISYESNLMWTKEYGKYDKLFVALDYMQTHNLAEIEKKKRYSAVLRTLNSFNNIDFFNELLYYKDNITKKDYYDYGIGIKVHISDDFLISCKGENIFNHAKEVEYINSYGTTNSYLKAPTVSQKLIVGLEYLF